MYSLNCCYRSVKNHKEHTEKYSAWKLFRSVMNEDNWVLFISKKRIIPLMSILLSTSSWSKTFFAQNLGELKEIDKKNFWFQRLSQNEHYCVDLWKHSPGRLTSTTFRGPVSPRIWNRAFLSLWGNIKSDVYIYRQRNAMEALKKAIYNAVCRTLRETLEKIVRNFCLVALGTIYAQWRHRLVQIVFKSKQIQFLTVVQHIYV